MIASGCVWSTWSAGDERVQERLDRRPWLVGADGAAQEVVDHLRVVHRVAVAERKHLVEAQPGEARARDRRQIGAGALDPEHAHLAPRVVGDRLLRRRVAAADIRERAVGAEQVRAVDEALEHAQAARGTLVPAIVGSGDAVQHGRRLAHEVTSTGFRCTRSAKRCARLVPFGRARAARGRSGANDARTTSRASSSDPSSPSAIAWTSRLPTSVASSGPARTGSPVACAVHRQSSSFRAPPPTMCSSDGVCAGDLAEQVDGQCVLQREALEDAAGRRARILRRGLAGARRRRRAILRRHVARRRRSVASSGSTNAPERGRGRRERDSSSKEWSWPCVAQARRHSCSSQSPVTFRSSRNVPADAALVGQVRGEGRVGDQRLGRPRRPTSDHVPALTNTESGWRNGTAATAEPVSCVATAITVAPSGAPRLARRRAGRAAFRTRRRRARGRAGIVEPVEQVARPGRGVRVEALRRGRVRQLGRSRFRRASSGRGRGSAAASPPSSSAGSLSATIAASSKTVLIGSSWMPVRS